MEILVKTLSGSSFVIEAKPEDTVSDMKKIIESVKGPNVYPAALQMLICRGKVLTDDTTLDENKVTENRFVVVMLSKAPQTSVSPTSSVAPVSSTIAPARAPASALVPDSTDTTMSVSAASAQASASPAGNPSEEVIQLILDMGGETWDRDTVTNALRAAYNNPERAIEFLYSNIQAETHVARSPVSDLAANPLSQSTQAASVPLSWANANHLNIIPQVLANMDSDAVSLESIRNNPDFQAFRNLVRANPQILRPTLRQLARQNPRLMRIIRRHQSEFRSLINEPLGGVEGNVSRGELGAEAGGLGAAMLQTVLLSSEDQEAMGRLEAMGFDRSIALQVYFACNKNEELAANYLLDNIHDFDD